MKKYFLMGSDGIGTYKTKDYASMLKWTGDWALVEYTPEDVNTFVKQIINWDDYLELTEDEAKYLKKELNVVKWNYLFKGLEETTGEDLSDGEMLDYLMENYKVPELL